jgi:hypothetical protein
VIARELLGTGYAGTIVACVLAAFALRSLKSAKGADAHRQTGKVLVSPLGGALGTGPVLREVLGSARDRKMLWVLLALVPIPLVVAADATLDYFFAIRQLIVVLPAVAILVSLGIESAGGRFGIRNGSLIAAALLVLNVAYSVSWLRKPREDWQAAAQLLNDGVARGGCAVFLPAATASYYALFRSDLTAHTCDDRILQEARYVLVAVSPYLRDSTVEKNELDHLARQGWVVSSRTANSKPEVVFLSRANH